MRLAPAVVLGLPRGGLVHGVHEEALACLFREQYTRPVRERHLVGHIRRSGLYIEDNRNGLALTFLENYAPAEWLLMIDSDISFEPDLIEQMLAAAGEDRYVVAGNVPLGQDQTCAYYALPQPGVFALTARLPEAKVFEADAAATAIMLIHRKVLEAIREAEGECWFYRHKVEVEHTNGYRWRKWLNLGEDISFCLRARSAGFKVWVARGLVGVKHWKTRGLVEEQGS